MAFGARFADTIYSVPPLYIYISLSIYIHHYIHLYQSLNICIYTLIMSSLHARTLMVSSDTNEIDHHPRAGTVALQVQELLNLTNLAPTCGTLFLLARRIRNRPDVETGYGSRLVRGSRAKLYISITEVLGDMTCMWPGNSGLHIQVSVYVRLLDIRTHTYMHIPVEHIHMYVCKVV